MDAIAVLMREPERVAPTRVPLHAPTAADAVVRIAASGISAGTERLLWQGRMPPFPGMGYPLVPGYESVGEVVEVGAESGRRVGDWVFVPGARCFAPLDGQEVRGLFGGAASRLVVPGAKALPLDAGWGERGVLLALAATAQHALRDPPELIVGHGVFGRLLARLAVLRGAQPVVWERTAERMGGAEGYAVLAPDSDPRRDYRTIYDASGDAALLDTLIAHLAPGGEVVLAGFYAAPLSFAFPPAFRREARIRVAAEWQPEDLRAVRALVEDGRLSLDGLITHRAPAAQAEDAYRTAFGDLACTKMIIDWSGTA